VLSRWVWTASTAAALAFCAAASSHTAADVTPVARSFCSAVVSGGTQPQLLIVSDLPVRGFAFHRDTLNMEAAIRFVLARHRFKAGSYTVGYQACDDSNPQAAQGDLTKCAANAKAYAQDASVVGVVGTWSSSCAAVEIPILGQAPGGPLGMVSPTNTNVGLTHADAGTAPGEPARYYPAGRRNYVRVISADDAQARADALVAKRAGARRVFVLDDGTGYGLSVASAFRSTARKLALHVAGSGAWDPAQANFGGVARRVRATHADAVFLGGSGCPACGVLVRQLRAVIGAQGALIAPDGFTPVDDLAKAYGAPAEGMYVSIPGDSFADLSPLGRQVARMFGGASHLSFSGAAYAAQALEVLLDSIARSDGTRGSITGDLFTTHVRGGILGTFGFDRNGDTTLNPVLIYRVAGRSGRFDRVIDAPAP
jgi:branched-chain amino acid transport system substrate-binding protein